MGTIAQLATLLGTTAALLALFAESKSRYRRSIRETLELSSAFAHDDGLSQRFRERAGALAEEYLAEDAKAKYPMYVSAVALVVGSVTVLGVVQWLELDTATSPGDELAGNVVAGIAAGTLGLLLREPVGWLADHARALRVRIGELRLVRKWSSS